MPDHSSIYTLAKLLGESYGEADPRSYEAVRVVNALLNDDVLRAIAHRTSLDTDDVVRHLEAMARLATKETT